MTRAAPFLALSVLLALSGALAPGRSAAAGSSLRWMSEAEITSSFSGQTVDGEYPSGATFRETYAADGSVAYEDELRTTSGRWSVRSGSFCTIYDDDPTGGCFRVRKAGANCYEFYFTGRSEADAERPLRETPSWTARAWLDGEASTCKPEIGV